MRPGQVFHAGFADGMRSAWSHRLVLIAVGSALGFALYFTALA